MRINLYTRGLKGVFDIEQYCLDNNIDAEKVTYLSCLNNKVTKLKGLDKLFNLRMLNCGYNKLTKLDVSKLVSLEELSCYKNNITEIKGLNNLVNLERLSCENNKLTELDVSKLVNLRKLSCDDHELTVLDVSNLVNLMMLNGELYTQLEEVTEPDKLDLILSKIEKLEQIILDNKR